MLKSAFAIFLMLTAGFSTDAFAAGCEPGPNQVTLYEHSNYGGKCSVLGVGDYRDSAATGLANDSVSSIKIGSNVQIHVANHSQKGNTSKLDQLQTGEKFSGMVEQTFTRSQSSLKGTRIGNDRISWVTVRYRTAAENVERGDCYPGDNSSSIAIYQHNLFKGNCRILPLGHYRNSKEMNFKNDSASSVEFVDLATLAIAFVSECKTSGFVLILKLPSS